MTSRLRDLISQVRECKSAAEERQIVAAECAAIRTKFKEDDDEFRHRNVAKLLFIHMLGYPSHFGQMACVRLVASDSFNDKRIGYLGLMLLLDENQEVLMLVTNCLKLDLNNKNQYVVGLGLTALGNISTADICRDLAPEVEKLLSSSNPHIRKKASLAAVRIMRKCPDLLENLLPKARGSLAGTNNGPLLTATTLLIEMCLINREAVTAYSKQLVPVLVGHLKKLIGAAPAGHEYEVSGVNDPFFQVQVLRLLRHLGTGNVEASEMMNDVLASVASTTDTTKNVGNAILYECVLTIMSIESETGLRVLAINILGRFLLNKDNNIRYVALNTLALVLTDDMQAVQRHRNTIVDCLRDPDISIRRRALELIYAIINSSNVRSLCQELMTYLEVADAEVKEDLTRRICTAAEKYSPDPQWYVDTILTVLRLAGNAVAADVFDRIVVKISKSDSVYSYTVHKFIAAMQADLSQEKLVLLGAWTIGEYGELLGPVEGLPAISSGEAVDVLEKALAHPMCTPAIRAYVLTALIKLTSRLSGEHDRILALIRKFATSVDVDLQQRSCEYMQLYRLGDRNALLDRMPVLEDTGDDEGEGLDDDEVVTTAAVVAANNSGTSSGAGGGAGAGAGGGLLSGLGVASSPASSLLAGGGPVGGGGGGATSLIDLLGGGGGVSGGSPAPPVAGGSLASLLGGSAPPLGGGGAGPAAGGGGGASLLSLLTTPSAPGPSPAGPSSGGAAASFAPTIEYNANGIQIMFEYAKQPGNPKVTAINAVFSNANPFPITEFQFLIAVPKYIDMRMSPPSSTSIPAAGGGNTTQVIHLQNNNMPSPVLIKYQLTLVANGQKFTTQGDCANVPPNL